eukprot:TRINITY_DN29905_c0_g1_i1.p1 TRINITY_DN29905_c0_g1~~TRINITY_DN29905_c0_g1_i1.p1  ORF type:complete len:524 (-),score=99.78 TRINITY_DN29905_c0_g1_i1:106-1677(-)
MESLFFKAAFCIVMKSLAAGSFLGLAAAAPFHSAAIDDAMNDVMHSIKDPRLKKLFSNAFPNTLNTTVQHVQAAGEDDTFVITGDIPAMWLRDSMNQVLPYFPYIQQDANLQRMLKGVLIRQTTSITNGDPYANAFQQNKTKPSPHAGDATTILEHLTSGKPINATSNNLIYEHKFELDSLAAFLRLSWEYYHWTDASDLSVFQRSDWQKVVQTIYDVALQQQQGTDEELDARGYFAYTFQRDGREALDSLVKSAGRPAKRCGLVRAGFRPSDDAQALPFHIPGNAMFSVYLKKVALILGHAQIGQLDLSQRLLSLGNEIEAAVWKHGTVQDFQSGELVFAYEVDGFGNHYMMDDANVPSLLSLPYIGFVDLNRSDDIGAKVYRATRSLVLDINRNPYYFKGTAGEGIGGPHLYMDHVWPMAIIMRGMTALQLSTTSSAFELEVKACLKMILDTHAGTYFIHESFNKNNASDYTRGWFAWANSLLGEFVVAIKSTKPHILQEIFTGGPAQVGDSDPAAREMMV